MHRLLLSILAATAAAVELPVTSVTVLPDGLIVERAGSVPVGDEVIGGLPADLDEGSLSIEVGGHEVDGWRLLRPQAGPAPLADPTAQQRLAIAERAAATARFRSDLAAAARRPAEVTAGERRPLPGPDAIRAQLAFAASNAERAAAEAQSAAEAADAAGNALAAAPDSTPAAPVLRLPGLSGKMVRLRYLLPGATWTPGWRLEVDGDTAILVQLATIDLSSREALPAVPLTVATRGRADAALLADPSVPILGLAESVALERHRAIGQGGGVKHSESAVSGGLGVFKRRLVEGTGTTAGDAQMLLAFLGAGYDHKTPNTHRAAIRAGLARLTANDPARLELPVLALATTALAEAWAMTNDPELRPRTEAFLDDLRRRWSDELSGWLSRSGPLAGPGAATLVVQALKSSQAGGLETGDDLRRLRELDLGSGEAAELARLYIDVFTGGTAPFIDLDTARRWVASFDRWWNAGQIERLHMALLVAFQTGGEEWRLVNDSLRDRLVGLQIRGGPDDGLWPLDHHPLGRLYGSIQATLCLEIYYRYAQVRADQRLSQIGEMVSVEALATSTPVVDLAWPMRLTAAQPVALVPGRQVVELRRARLAGAITWQAVPAQSPGVWRHLSAPNPWATPLPGAPVAVMADGRLLGNANLAATGPAAAIELDLGPDDRLRVRRTVRSTTDDGVFKRTLAMTVTCRLEAPPGFTDPVLVREPLPQPGGELIAVELLRPDALEGEAYAKRLLTDPQTSATLSAAAPETVLAELRLVYSRSVRPRLEVR